ncbi:laminin subunit gamma-1 isoform X1 [Ixodes scapularis]
MYGPRAEGTYEAECKCNGHAQACDPGPGGDRQLVCRCEHNTTGDNCERCVDSFNDQPWGRATSSDAHECQPCNCNGRSRKCYFDKELYDRTGHGGHCINCSDNTDGPNCERCRENFYQRSDGRCVACGCDPLGSRVLQCNSKGQCPCKPGVEGQRCDRCAPNFYDFSEQGCRPCGCSMAGSVDSPPSCDAATGVCRCKANVEGRQCDRCRPGFFNLQRDNEFGCTPCFCFGHSAVCQSAPGYSKHTVYSTFTRDKEHWKAVDSRGTRVPTRHEYAAHHLAVAAPGENQVYFVAPERFLGDQRGSYNQNLTFTLRIGEEGARSSLEDVVLESPSQSVSQHIFGQGNPLPSIRNQDYRFRLHQDSRYGWSPTLSAHEFMALLANLTAIKIRATYLPRGTGFIDNIELHTAQRSQYGSEAASWIEMCTCPDGYVGQFCESCAPGFRHDPPGGGRFSRCVPCNCNGHALICEPDTGHCICQHNTAGEFCERCAPRFYGNALVGSPEDCQPCPCPDQGACAVLPDESVVCLECPQGYSEAARDGAAHRQAARDEAAKQKLLETGRLTVKGRMCVIVDPFRQKLKVKLHWVSFGVTNDDIHRAFSTFGDVKQVALDRWRVPGFEGVGSTTRIVRLVLWEGAGIDRLPHQLRLGGGTVLVVVPGRAPTCLRCGMKGHIRLDCRAPRCSECRAHGHERADCVRSYARVAGRETAVVQPKGAVGGTGAGPTVVSASSAERLSTAVPVLAPEVAHQSATPPENSEVGPTPVPEEDSTSKEMDVEAGTAKRPHEDITEASQERRLRQLERKWRMVAAWKRVDSQPWSSSPKGRERLPQ